MNESGLDRHEPPWAPRRRQPVAKNGAAWTLVAMKAAVRGFLVGVLFLVLAAAWILIGVARGYDGTCGGLFPFLAGPRECPFMEYFIGMGGTSLLIAVVQGWPVALAVLLVPTGAGYWLGRRSAHSV